MGEIVSIWIKRAHGGPMDRVVEAELVVGRGVRGNADQGGKRQITIIDEGASSRRANVMLRGLNLEDSRGKLLLLGNCTIRIYGEVRPCQLMDEMHLGLRKALTPRWRGGVFAEIVQGGEIRVGDSASWVD